MNNLVCACTYIVDSINHLSKHALCWCREKYMRFGLEGGKSVILDRVQATTDGPIILKQHAITFDRSADLQNATNNKCVAEQPGTPAQQQ